MRILLITPFLPYAEARAGCPRAVLDRIRLLTTDHELTVVTFVEPAERAHYRALMTGGAQVHGVLRRPDVGLVGLNRWRKRAQLLFGLIVRGKPVLVQEFGSRQLRRVLSRLLSQQTFDLVLVEHILMAQYLDTKAPTGGTAPPVVLSEHDLRLAIPDPSVAHKPQTAIGKVSACLHWLDRVAWRRYALRAWRRAALVTVPTREDGAVLGAIAPEVRSVVVPFGLAVDELCLAVATCRDEASLLFVGNFNHPPNVDAACWLVTEILPLIQQACPTLHLWLVGKDPPPAIWALLRPGVTITGEVPAVADYLLRCTVFVAPLRVGAGVRMKLLEALAAGAAIVTTPRGAQGLDAQPGRQLLVADDAPAFAAAVVRLLSDPAARAALSAAGRALVCSPDRDRQRRRSLDRLLRDVIATDGASGVSRSVAW